jgi:hypothetical protein
VQLVHRLACFTGYVLGVEEPSAFDASMETKTKNIRYSNWLKLIIPEGSLLS